MESSLFVTLKSLSKNLLQSTYVHQILDSQIEKCILVGCKQQTKQSDKNMSGKNQMQSLKLRNARTPPIIKIKNSLILDEKSCNLQRFSNNSYVKHESIYKESSKRTKTQQARKTSSKNFPKSNCFKSQAIQLKNSLKMIKAVNIKKQKIKNRKPQKSLDELKPQEIKSIEKSVQPDHQNQQMEDLCLKALTKRPIKLGKIVNNKIYLKFSNNTVKKRDSFLKQTNIRQQIKTFNELQAMKKQYNQKLRNFVPPPIISANSYIIVQVLNNISNILNSSLKKEKSIKKNQESKNTQSSYQNFKFLASYNFKLQHQVASLTKIMTCILVIQLCQKHFIPIQEAQFQITKFQHEIQGTSAKIKIEQIYTIQQLLYGLMLPSGNDASLALAVWTGNILLMEKFQLRSQIEIKYKRKQCLKRFIDEMNKKASIIGMQKTRYANPHGLNDSQNKSCAYDIVKLTNYCMKNKRFAQIVGCKEYTSYVKYKLRNNNTEQQTEIQNMKSSQIISSQSTIDQKLEKTSFLCKQQSQNSLKNDFGSSTTNLKYRLISWQNTNKLLDLKANIYKGVKTGITSQAGACLSSFIQFQDRTFIIVVLGCRSATHRFKQTQMLRKHIFKQQGLYKGELNSQQEPQNQQFQNRYLKNQIQCQKQTQSSNNTD